VLRRCRKQCHPAVPRGLRDLKRLWQFASTAPTPPHPRSSRSATSVKSLSANPGAQLVVAKHRSKVHNNPACIHCRHRGAGLSGLYRMLTSGRDKHMVGRPRAAIHYDPHRNARWRCSTPRRKKSVTSLAPAGIDWAQTVVARRRSGPIEPAMLAPLGHSPGFERITTSSSTPAGVANGSHPQASASDAKEVITPLKLPSHRKCAVRRAVATPPREVGNRTQHQPGKGRTQVAALGRRSQLSRVMKPLTTPTVVRGRLERPSGPVTPWASRPRPQKPESANKRATCLCCGNVAAPPTASRGGPDFVMSSTPLLHKLLNPAMGLTQKRTIHGRSPSAAKVERETAQAINP